MFAPRVKTSTRLAASLQAPPQRSGPIGRLQRKLAVGRTDNPLEAEADRVADQVMRIPAPELAVTSAPVELSRKCATCEEDEQVQRKRSDVAEPDPAEAPSVVHDVLRSPRQPLDHTTRAYFEPRLGQDFSHVWVCMWTRVRRRPRGA